MENYQLFLNLYNPLAQIMLTHICTQHDTAHTIRLDTLVLEKLYELKLQTKK